MAVYKGNNGTNIFNGTLQDDILYGYGGNDILNGDSGNDIIYGGNGDDTLMGGVGNDLLLGGTGTDTYLFAKGDGKDKLIDGDNSTDLIKFTDAASTDVKAARSYDYRLLLSYGDTDQLTFRSFFSTLNYHNKQFQFSDGVIWGWKEIKREVLQGTDGNDFLQGFDNEHNKLFGLAGNDNINGGNLSDTLNGGLGNDRLTGFDGDDILIGGAGNDRLSDFAGADTFLFAKGDGKDSLLSFEQNGASNTVKFTDVALSDLTKIDHFLIHGLAIHYGNGDILGIFNQFYSKTYQIDEFKFAGGTTLTGFIVGTTGNDTLTGTAANNALAGLEGADTMDGGAGNDLYIVDNIGDTITETSNLASEMDTVNSSITYTLGNNVENLNLITSRAINGFGNTLNNAIKGNDSANMLSGDAGADTITGGNGADKLMGGLGKDKLILTETVAAKDQVVVVAGDSLLNAYDTVTGFKSGDGLTTSDKDQLGLSKTLIAADIGSSNGVDVDTLHSHHIANGIISFDDVDNFGQALVLSAQNVASAFKYLQANLTAGETAAFTAAGNSYVFQDNGMNDTAVALIDVIASNLNTTGLAVNGIWLVN